jgi:hypothetical protein
MFLAKKSKTAGFYVDFKFVDEASKTAPKKFKAKNDKKYAKTTILKIRIFFQP